MSNRALLSSHDAMALKFAAITAVVCVGVMLGLAFMGNLIG
jgi:hypothetical protein